MPFLLSPEKRHIRIVHRYKKPNTRHVIRADASPSVSAEELIALCQSRGAEGGDRASAERGGPRDATLSAPRVVNTPARSPPVGF